MNIREATDESLDVIRRVTDFGPQVALILGTGLGGLADEIEIVAEIGYESVPGFPVSTVESHAGRLLFGHLA